MRSGGPASSNQAERTGTRQGQLTRQVQFTRQGQVRVKYRYAPRKGMQQGQAHGKGRYAAGTWTCHGQVRYAARTASRQGHLRGKDRYQYAARTGTRLG